MKSIETLIPDIQELVTRKDGWFNETLSTDFARSVASRIETQYSVKTEPPRLRLSQMGPRCPKALWHSIHTPELAEPLPPWAEVKFSFGHIIEALAITLAKASGHEVLGEQDAVMVDGVPGHRDCIIDGCIVDVKSSSSIGMEKFKKGTLPQMDTFGYLDQLDGYLLGSVDDPLVRVKDTGYILAIDKTLGHMVVYEHALRSDRIRVRISSYKQIVSRAEPPDCECEVVLDGKSGNVRLGTKASYSNFKHCCFPRLRTFLYAEGPRYLTKVVRTPDVPEINREGLIIHR